MKHSLYTLAFSAIMAVVCALLLTGVGRFTAPYKEANEKADKLRSILEVLQVPFRPDDSAQRLVEIFKTNVREEKRGNATVYEYAPPDSGETVKMLAVAFAGQGLWGPIKGFLALAPDMKTIRGLAFQHQEETPGLGGEIASDSFRRQFDGRSLASPSGEPGVRIRQGGGKGQNEVDAISGATMTCNKLEAMINAAIAEIVQEHSKHGQ